jgi:hypothetical protein
MYTERAANFGTRMHEAIEFKLAGRGLPEILTVQDVPFVFNVFEWLEANPIKVESLEFTFANKELGYGGRIDCIGDVDISGLGREDAPTVVRCIIDWKTQATQPGRPFRHYPEHGMQVAGYGGGINEEGIYGLNLMISSTEPGRIEPYLWLDFDKNWFAFEAARRLYYSVAGPGKNLSFAREFYHQEVDDSDGED